MRQGILAAAAALFMIAPAKAFDHFSHSGHGAANFGYMPGTNGFYKPSWGVSSFSRFGHGFGGFSSGYARFGFPGFGFSGYGYSSFGGFGGLNYYQGPVGGPWIAPYGYGYTSFGYPNFGPTYSYIPMAPIVQQAHPLWIGRDPFDNAAIQEWMPGNGQPQNNPAAQPAPPPEEVELLIKPSNAEAKRKSIRYQAQGDEYFAKQNYLQAFARYKQAVGAAADRPEPRYRMAVALAAMNEFPLAADELKRTVRVDPGLPRHGDRLDDVFGANNNLAKNSMLQKAAAWVREDIRDPNRLFLMGALLHFNEDRDKAQTLFQTADLLAGSPDYVRAFLKPPEAGPRENIPARPQPQALPPAPIPNPPPDAPEPAAPKVPAAGRPTKAPQPVQEGPRLLPPADPVNVVNDGR